MKRHQLEHLLRAAGGISEQDRIIVIGSQSILGALEDAPEPLLMSMEADFIFPDRIDVADLIDGTIGEGSIFHETHGYYAQGVDLTTAKLPSGWEDRLIEVKSSNTRGVSGLCLSPADLIASKYAAGRDKDFEYIRQAFRYGIVSEEEVIERIQGLPLSAEEIEVLKVKIRRDIDISQIEKPVSDF